MNWLEQQAARLSIAMARRPFLTGALLTLTALAFFGWRLAEPSKLNFDETHYVPAARAMWALESFPNQEHPPLVKWMIGLGIWLFGDNPWGWRAYSLAMGAASAGAVYALGLMLTRSPIAALGAWAFTLLDQMVYVQARIAMLDASMAGWLLIGAALLLGAARRHFAFTQAAMLAGAGVCFGLAAASKWAALLMAALMCLGFAAARIGAVWRALGFKPAAMLLGRGVGPWPGVSALGAGALIVAPMAATYFATFIPVTWIENGAPSLGELLSHQLHMYALQTQPLADHQHNSPWWEWPLPVEPMWYFYEEWDGAWRGVLLVGNPAIMWGGFAAVWLALAIGWATRDWALAAAPLAYLGAWGAYIVIPKAIGFYYYYYLPAILLGLVLAVLLHRLCQHGWTRWVPIAFGAVAAGWFIHFFPILSARPLEGGGAFLDWMWFASWP